MAYIVEPKEYREEYEEPCLNCFKQIHYARSEAEWINKRYGYGYFIKCPNCGEYMKVSFISSLLC